MQKLTRRKLVSTLLAGTAVIAAPAWAQDPIFRNGLQGRDPQETFALMILSSLARASNGSAPIPGATDTFAKPVDVYETLRRLNPNAGPGFTAEHPTPEQLLEMVAYIRTLRLRRLTATSRFYNTTVSRRGGVRHIVYDGVDTLRAGVEVLADPRTDDAIFKRDCGNGLGQCVYIDFEVRDPREFEVLWERIAHAGDHCFAWRRVDRLFQHDSEEARWNRVEANSICGDCTFVEANQIIGRRPAAEGTLPVEPGIYQIRLIRNERVLLCLKRRDSGGLASSFTVDVSWQRGDYQRVGEEWHAHVHYQSQELVDAGVALSNGPRTLVWYASTEGHLRQMQGLSVQARPGE